jgi:hypothetical protein
MGSGLRKKKGKWGFNPMPSYFRSELENNAYIWCINNNIKIAPFAVANSSPRKWWIDVNTQGKIKRSPYQYDESQIWHKLFELYVFYYKKYGLRNTV